MRTKTALLLIWRKLKLNKTFTLLNIAGLGIGLSVAIVVFLYVNHEMSFDKFNKDADLIYMSIYNAEDLNPVFPIPFSEALQDEVPEVEAAANIFPWELERTITVPSGDFSESCRFMDENIFKIFSFPVISQRDKNIFPDMNALAISEKMAVKLFGSVENAIGQSVMLDRKKTCNISAIFKNIPSNSSLRFEMAAPSESVINEFNISTQWGDWNVRSFVKLNAPEAQVKNSFADFSEKHDFKFSLFPLAELHLAQKGSEQKKTLLIAIAASIFVMLLACINFINLSTANFFKRTKEVGINKLLGSSSFGMYKLFITETLIITFISFLVAVLLSLFLLPYVNQLIGLTLSFAQLNIFRISLLLGIVIITSLITAFIPAYLFSKARPIQIFDKQAERTGPAIFLRKGLIILQLSLTILIITSTLFINKQVQFISNTNMGFNKENMVFIDPGTSAADMVKKVPSLKNELLKNPFITSVSAIDCTPGIIGTASRGVNWPRKSKEDKSMAYLLSVSDDFIKTFGINIAEGTDFKGKSEEQGVLINKTLAGKVEQDGSSNEKILYINDKRLKILGVVEDFSFNSIKDNQQASIIFYQPSRGFYPCIRFSDDAKIPEVLSQINRSMSDLCPNMDYRIKFTNDFILEEYMASEIRLSKFFSLFSILGIIVCSIGLLGLALFEGYKRTKEIGVRKVNGAQIREILIMLNKDYAQWVAIAWVIAMPVAYYAMHRWLQNFTYQTTLSWWIFVLACLLVFGIAIITVSWQSWRVATRNPVEALRYE